MLALNIRFARSDYIECKDPSGYFSVSVLPQCHRETVSNIFEELWKSEGKHITNCLADSTIAGPNILSEFSWRARMKVGQSSAAKLRDSSVIFNFTTSTPEKTGQKSCFAVEFTHEKLYNFFAQSFLHS